MRITSFNANGLRSATSKGFFDWFATQDTDILCVQETKAQEHQLRGEEFLPAGYKAWFRDATTKKGYSGVGIYSRREPDEVRTALGWEPFEEEGRYIEGRFAYLSVGSFYIASGASGGRLQSISRRDRRDSTSGASSSSASRRATGSAPGSQAMWRSRSASLRPSPSKRAGMKLEAWSQTIT